MQPEGQVRRTHPLNIGRGRVFAFCSLVVLAALALSGCAGYTAKNLTEPQLVITPNVIDFKSVVVGQKNTQTIQLSNPGSAPLAVTQIQVSGKGFLLTPATLPLKLSPGSSKSLTLAFDPVAPGNATGTLSVMTDDSKISGSVPVSGVGEKAVAQLQVTPASLNFGNLKVQTTSSKNVTLKNTGDVNVTINGVTLTGSGFGFSDLTPGFSLAPQQQLTFQVWFKPVTKGAASGKLALISSSLAAPVSLPLAGDGTTTAPPTQHSVKLDWNPSASAVTGYQVYRSDDSGGPYGRISSSEVGGLSFSDPTVSSGATYFYVVTAVNSAGDESGFSNETPAVIPNP
jgi:ASPM-SPD-2-Hydin domain-containing protein/centrosomal CEP192-like protein